MTGISTMNQLKRCKPGLGTYVTIALEGPVSDEVLISHSNAAFQEIQRIEALMSFHNPQSELSRINREAFHGPVAVSVQMDRVLSFALQLSAMTEGRFDPTVAASMVERGVLPDHGYAPQSQGNWRDIQLENQHISFSKPLLLDLGGVAKGYAVDCAFEQIPESLNVTVDAGGDLRTRPWKGEKVGLRVPGQYEWGSVLEIDMGAPAMATSSKYFSENGHPIVCPNTGEPIGDPRSVTVFARKCMVADALTKCVFLIPDSDTLLERWDATALVVDPQEWGG